MNKPHTLIMLFFLILFLAGSGLGLAQPIPQVLPQDAAAVPPDAALNETGSQPGESQKISLVTVQNDRLSVNFVDTEFEEIVRTVSSNAGFTIQGSSTAFNKKVTTKFDDLDLEKGIKRLFTLVNESNYRIDYDSKGAISKIRIYGITASRSGSQTTGILQTDGTAGGPARRNIRQRSSEAGFRPVAPPQPNTLFNQSPRNRRMQLPAQAPQPAENPQAPEADEDPEHQQEAEPQPPQPQSSLENPEPPAETVREIPYTPPQAKKPLYPFRIPAIKR